MEPDEIDRLENYALTWRIRGKTAWNADFTGHPDGYGQQFDEKSTEKLAALNGLRSRAAAPFDTLADGLAAAKTARDSVQALYDFLLAVNAPGRMAARAAGY